MGDEIARLRASVEEYKKKGSTLFMIDKMYKLSCALHANEDVAEALKVINEAIAAGEGTDYELSMHYRKGAHLAVMCDDYALAIHYFVEMINIMNRSTQPLKLYTHKEVFGIVLCHLACSRVPVAREFMDRYAAHDYNIKRERTFKTARDLTAAVEAGDAKECKMIIMEYHNISRYEDWTTKLFKEIVSVADARGKN